LPYMIQVKEQEWGVDRDSRGEVPCEHGDTLGHRSDTSRKPDGEETRSNDKGMNELLAVTRGYIFE